jgi:hypothetical protein
MRRSRQIQLEGGIKYLDPEFVWDKARVPVRVRPPVAPLSPEVPHAGGNVAESLRPRCACVTAKGTQCTRTPFTDSLFCKAHATTCKNKIPFSMATATAITAVAATAIKSPFKSPKSPKSVGVGSRPKSATRQSPPKSKLSSTSLHLSFPSRPSASRSRPSSPSRPTAPFLSFRSTSPRALVSTPLATARPVPTCAAEHAANAALLAANAALRSKAIARIKSLKRVAQATQEQTQRVRQELGVCLASAQKARDSSPQVAPVVLLQLASQALARASTVLKALETSVTIEDWMTDIGRADSISEAETQVVWDGIPRLFCKAAADCIHCAVFVLDRCVQQDRETLHALPKDRVPLVTEPMQIKELENVLLQLCPACMGTYDLTDTTILERFVSLFFDSRHSSSDLQAFQKFLGSLRATVEAAGRKRGTSQVMLGFSETPQATNPVFERVARRFMQLKDSTSQLIAAANDFDAFDELVQSQLADI